MRNVFGQSRKNMCRCSAWNPSGSSSAWLSCSAVPSSKAMSRILFTMGISPLIKLLLSNHPSVTQVQQRTNFGCSRRNYTAYVTAPSTGMIKLTVFSAPWASRRTHTTPVSIMILSKIQMTPRIPWPSSRLIWAYLSTILYSSPHVMPLKQSST